MMFKNIKFSLLGIILSLFVYMLGVWYNFDIFDVVMKYIHSFEGQDLDGFIILAPLALSGVIIDFNIKRNIDRQTIIEQEFKFMSLYERDKVKFEHAARIEMQNILNAVLISNDILENKFREDVLTLEDFKLTNKYLKDANDNVSEAIKKIHGH